MARTARLTRAKSSSNEFFRDVKAGAHTGPPRCGECHGPLSQGAGAASRRLPAEQLVEIDIALAGRPDVADLETVGLEPIFH